MLLKSINIEAVFTLAILYVYYRSSLLTVCVSQLLLYRSQYGQALLWHWTMGGLILEQTQWVPQAGVSTATVMARRSLKWSMRRIVQKEKMLKSGWHPMCKHIWHITAPQLIAAGSPSQLPSKGLLLALGGIPDLILKYLKANIDIVPLNK